MPTEEEPSDEPLFEALRKGFVEAAPAPGAPAPTAPGVGVSPPLPPAPDGTERALDWMQTLFSALQQQKLSDNHSIWEIGKLFVPISVAPFVIALDSSKHLTLGHLGVCALVSVAVYLLWLSFAARHKVFQQQNEDAQLALLAQLVRETDRARIRKLKGLSGLFLEAGPRKARVPTPRPRADGQLEEIHQPNWLERWLANFPVHRVRFFGLVFLVFAWGVLAVIDLVGPAEDGTEPQDSARPIPATTASAPTPPVLQTSASALLPSPAPATSASAPPDTASAASAPTPPASALPAPRASVGPNQ